MNTPFIIGFVCFMLGSLWGSFAIYIIASISEYDEQTEGYNFVDFIITLFWPIYYIYKKGI